MKTISNKTAKVGKGRNGKYGVIKTELKKLQPYIGQTVTIQVKTK